LDSPTEFVTSALKNSMNNQWDKIADACGKTIENSLSEDPSKAHFLQMITSFKKMISDILSHTDDSAINECISHLAKNMLFTVASDYNKVGSGSFSSSIEHFSNAFSHLIEKSHYILNISKEIFAGFAIVFVSAAFRWFLFDLMFQAMYENLIPSFSKIYKIFEEKSSISNSEIFDFIRLAGQMVLWIENDRSMLKMLLDAYLNEEKQIPAIQFSTFLKNEIANFDKKISNRAEGDITIAKARSDLRSITRRIVNRSVDLLTRPLVTNIINGSKSLKAKFLNNKMEANLFEGELPSFGTTPDEFVTAAGVSLLSIAHQLSIYSQDVNMATALAIASKTETIDDIGAWWIERCSNVIQECFIDSVGPLENLSTYIGRQFGINYG
uniref:Structural protein n=1 Tax=Dracunculus medinensis TaxID=318479 RepID=A0A0N4U4G9_DRAME